MRSKPLKPASALAAVIVCLPGPALAQELTGSALLAAAGGALGPLADAAIEAPETVAARNHRASLTRVLELGVQYGAPERLSGGISGVFFHEEPNPRKRIQQALTIHAAAGQGGFSVGIGHRAALYGPFGPEASMTVTRTFSSPRGSTGRSIYVGLEVGYVSMGRVSIGVARQVDGPQIDADTVLTWSVGAQIPYGFWRW